MILNNGFKVKQQRVILCNQITWSRKSGFLQCRLSCLFSSEIFNIWKLLFHFTWLIISGNSFDILYYSLQIYNQNWKSFKNAKKHYAFNVIPRKIHTRENICETVSIFCKHIYRNLFRFFVKLKLAILKIITLQINFAKR